MHLAHSAVLGAFHSEVSKHTPDRPYNIIYYDVLQHKNNLCYNILQHAYNIYIYIYIYIFIFTYTHIIYYSALTYYKLRLKNSSHILQWRRGALRTWTDSSSRARNGSATRGRPCRTGGGRSEQSRAPGGFPFNCN